MHANETMFLSMRAFSGKFRCGGDVLQLDKLLCLSLSLHGDHISFVFLTSIFDIYLAVSSRQAAIRVSCLVKLLRTWYKLSSPAQREDNPVLLISAKMLTCHQMWIYIRNVIVSNSVIRGAQNRPVWSKATQQMWKMFTILKTWMNWSLNTSNYDRLKAFLSIRYKQNKLYSIKLFLY